MLNYEPLRRCLLRLHYVDRWGFLVAGVRQFEEKHWCGKQVWRFAWCTLIHFSRLQHKFHLRGSPNKSKVFEGSRILTMVLCSCSEGTASCLILPCINWGVLEWMHIQVRIWKAYSENHRLIKNLNWWRIEGQLLLSFSYFVADTNAKETEIVG